MTIATVAAVPLGLPWKATDPPSPDPPSPWTARLGKQSLARIATDDGLVGCEPIRPVAGWLAAPAGPGLGGRPTEAARRDHPLGAAPSPAFTTG